MGVVAIYAPLVLYSQENQQAAGDPEGQAQDVQTGEGLILPEGPEGDFEVVYKHLQISNFFLS